MSAGPKDETRSLEVDYQVRVEMVSCCGWLPIAKQMSFLSALENEGVGQWGLQHEWELQSV